MKFYHIDKRKVRCPRCGKPMKPAMAIADNVSPTYLRCSVMKCKTFFDTSIPLPSQEMIALDSANRVGVFGGYGCGKTWIDFKNDEKHILITPNGESLIGADTLVQIENTVKKDLERDFPMEFVKHYSRQKNKITFENNHVLYYRPMASEGDLRSYNLTRAHLLEASEIKHESYVQIQSRVRNDAAIIPERHSDGSPVVYWDKKAGKFIKKMKYSWLQTVVESNPDSGWIRNDFLYRSGKITLHHQTDQKYEVPAGFALPFVSSHIIPTKANFHLPADFEDNLRAGKPPWWVKRYLEGSFEYSEGLVYPSYVDSIVNDFPIPDDWQRIIGFDYGLNDNSHFVFGAIDWDGTNPITGKPAIFFFAELVYNDMNIKGLSDQYKKMLRRIVPMGSLYRTPAMDAKSYGLRQKTGNLKTLGTLFREYGCFFKPAHMDMAARILHVNDFIANKRVFFFKYGFAQANAEFLEHKFVPKTLEKNRADEGKPQDKRNHGVNSTEFCMMEVSKKLKRDYNEDYNQKQDMMDILSGRKRKRRAQYDPLSDQDYYNQGNNEYEGFAKFF